ncbi:MAG: hypothetical protein ACRDZ2_00915, partial [Ilumatobacteraceae bacterium]
AMVTAGAVIGALSVLLAVVVVTAAGLLPLGDWGPGASMALLGSAISAAASAFAWRTRYAG